MYIPSYNSALMGLNRFVKCVTDYRIYAAYIVSRNRYGRHGRRKAN